MSLPWSRATRNSLLMSFGRPLMYTHTYIAFQHTHEQGNGEIRDWHEPNSIPTHRTLTLSLPFIAALHGRLLYVVYHV